MKTLKSLVVLTAIIIPFMGMTQNSEMDLMRKIFSSEKKALVESFLQLTGSDANIFWDHYNAYETERKALSDKRIALIEDYAEMYNTLTNEQATDLMNRSFKLRGERMKLQQRYFKENQ